MSVYDDMAMDAGCRPGSDEMHQMAAAIEESQQLNAQLERLEEELQREEESVMFGNTCMRCGGNLDTGFHCEKCGWSPNDEVGPDWGIADPPPKGDCKTTVHNVPGNTLKWSDNDLRYLPEGETVLSLTIKYLTTKYKELMSKQDVDDRDLSIPFDQGERAYRDGLERYINPYTKGSKQWQSWDCGYANQERKADIVGEPF